MELEHGRMVVVEWIYFVVGSFEVVYSVEMGLIVSVMVGVWSLNVYITVTGD